MRTILTGRPAKAVLFAACLAPLVRLVVKGFTGGLGANPIEFITRSTGTWTLSFLVLTLSITPARRLFDLPDLIRFRRMLGLFAFFYATLHFFTYLWLDKFFDFADMWKDVLKRPFITVGFAAFTLLIPLAATSTNGWVRRLGKRWRTLHRLIYASAALGVVHYYWLVKSDIRLPVLFGAAVGILLVARVRWKKSPALGNAGVPARH